ncbi:MAG: deoxyribose-phosphate aldolase [Dysgonomonadaceae bacterium]|nr:deoxyribose-phosphate aldolase [Dysgonamonadaceae bacterium]
MDIKSYTDVLRTHSFDLSDEQVKSKVAELINEKYAENNNKQVYKLLYSCIDLTSLNGTDTREHIWKMVQQVNDFEGTNPEIDNVAAICVYPNFAKTIREALTADVQIACVSGGFPTSQTFTETKIAETALAVMDGADEIDIVINLGLFFGEEYEEMCEEIDEIKFACHEAKLKVILETGALKTATNIHNAAILSMYSGADFIKTSTGKIYEGATLEAAYVMCHAIKSYYDKTKTKIGFKVAGGVSSVEDAVKYYTIMKEILGNEWCNKDLFRIGTSRLANTLLKAIED